jgi:ABC-type transport system involved in cytochrome c biogenesis permease subunit
MKRILALAIAVLCISACGDANEKVSPRPPQELSVEASPFPAKKIEQRALNADAIRSLAVQYDKRYQPFETFAKIHVRQVTGKSSFNGLDPVQVLLHWISNPRAALEERIIPLPSVHTCEAVGLERPGPGVTHTSLKRLLSHEDLLRKSDEAREKLEDKRPLSRVESEVWQLRQRIDALFRICDFERVNSEWAAAPGMGYFPIYPPDTDPVDGTEYMYASPRDVRELRYSNAVKTAAVLPFVNLLKAYNDAMEDGERKELQKTFDTSAAELKAAIVAMRPERDRNYPAVRNLEREVRLEHMNPFFKLKYQYFGVFFLAILCLGFRKNRVLWGLMMLALLAASGFHMWALIERTSLAGRAMIGNLYESALFATVAAAVIGLLAEAYYRTAWVAACGSFVAMLGLFWAQGNPEFWRPEISKLQPVLINNDLIHIHVPTMMVSYAILALSVILAHAYLIMWWFKGSASPPEKGTDLHHIGRYMMGSIPLGVVILFAGIILGGVWADASWGRFWGWDPKETASLVTWVAFVVIIHGWWAGWLRHVGTALACLFGGLTLIWTYWGANFVQSGLHSYAGSGTAIPTWPYYYFAIQVLVAAVSSVLWFKRRKLLPATEKAGSEPSILRDAIHSPT